MQHPKQVMTTGSGPAAESPLDRDTVDIEVVSRPDGYYWIAPDGHQEFGPFGSREEALQDIDRASEDAPEPGESLQEAEDELGIADWIDPDTSEPAEGRCTPRLAPE